MSRGTNEKVSEILRGDFKEACAASSRTCSDVAADALDDSKFSDRDADTLLLLEAEATIIGESSVSMCVCVCVCVHILLYVYYSMLRVDR